MADEPALEEPVLDTGTAAEEPGEPDYYVADFNLGMTRSMVAMGAFNEVKTMYEKTISDFADRWESAEYKAALDKCHAVGAEKAVAVARQMKGLYIKAAQFAASLQGGAGDAKIPKVYIDALRIFVDDAPNLPLEDMEPLLVEEFGNVSSELFQSIEEKPIASASLAQVHRAVLKDGRKVAVKLQYPALQGEMASDFAVFKMMGAGMQPGGFDIMWVIEDFEVAMATELDFTKEAGHGTAARERLMHRKPEVFVPDVVPEFSTKRVLTMEFCEGLIKVTDYAGMERAGLKKAECTAILLDTFMEMAFCHGKIHADPHAGNIYFRTQEGSDTTKPQLVILDHGLYHNLDDDLRSAFCAYIRACIFKDKVAMAKLGERFAGPLHRFFPLILSPWFIFGADVKIADLQAAKNGQLPPGITLRDIAEFIVSMRSSQGNLLGLLHSFGYTRGMLNELGCPEHLRIASFAKYSTLGLAPAFQRPPQPWDEPWRGRSAGLPIASELRRIQWAVSVLRCQISVAGTAAQKLSTPAGQVAAAALVALVTAVGIGVYKKYG